MNISNDFFNVKCEQCMDTGAYFNGRDVVPCDCGTKLKKKTNDTNKQRESNQLKVKS